MDIDQRDSRLPIVPSLLATLLLSVAGCGGSTEGLQGVKRQLEKSGHHLAGFTIAVDATGLGAVRCEAGRIDKLDALLCEFRDPAAAHRATIQESEWIGGAVTGTTVDRGPLTLALADRARVDPNGLVTSKVVHTFRGK